MRLRNKILVIQQLIKSLSWTLLSILFVTEWKFVFGTGDRYIHINSITNIVMKSYIK